MFRRLLISIPVFPIPISSPTMTSNPCCLPLLVIPRPARGMQGGLCSPAPASHSFWIVRRTISSLLSKVGFVRRGRASVGGPVSVASVDKKRPYFFRPVRFFSILSLVLFSFPFLCRAESEFPLDVPPAEIQWELANSMIDNWENFDLVAEPTRNGLDVLNLQVGFYLQKMWHTLIPVVFVFAPLLLLWFFRRHVLRAMRSISAPPERTYSASNERKDHRYVR